MTRFENQLTLLTKLQMKTGTVLVAGGNPARHLRLSPVIHQPHEAENPEGESTRNLRGPEGKLLHGRG